MVEKGKRRLLRLREKQLAKTAEGSANLVYMAENPINGQNVPLRRWQGCFSHGLDLFSHIWKKQA